MDAVPLSSGRDTVSFAEGWLHIGMPAFAAHSRLVGDLRRAGHDPPATNPLPAGVRASLLRDGSLLRPAGGADCGLQAPWSAPSCRSSTSR